MQITRTIAMTLCLTFASGGLLAGSAIAEDGRGPRQHRGGDDERDGDRDRWRERDDDNGGRWAPDDGAGRGREHRWEHGDDGGRYDRPGRWGQLVSVRVVNQRHQFVTLYLNGRYLGQVAPDSRERIALPPGQHVLTYQVGYRSRWHQVSVSAFPGQRNRVVIEGRWGRGWGGNRDW